jgi:ribonuclease HIII
MANSVSFNLASTKLEQKIVKYYQDFLTQPNSETIKYLFILPDCRITLYKSNKLLFQGKNAETESANWQQLTAVSKTNITTSTETSLKLTNYIGCDETGVGDYLAPMVAACCYITPKTAEKLTKYKIMDSKQLSDDYIITIAPAIKKILPHAIFTLSNEHYNRLIDNGYNSHAIKAFLHNIALGKLIEQSNLAIKTPIVMDQFASKKNYQKYLKDIKNVYLPTHFETKAENKFLAVACASIIARAQFMEAMQVQNETHQIEFPLGAGKHVDDFARKWFKTVPYQTFKVTVKWHFANTERIVSSK